MTKYVRCYLQDQVVAVILSLASTSALELNYSFHFRGRSLLINALKHPFVQKFGKEGWNHSSDSKATGKRGVAAAVHVENPIKLLLLRLLLAIKMMCAFLNTWTCIAYVRVRLPSLTAMLLRATGSNSALWGFFTIWSGQDQSPPQNPHTQKPVDAPVIP